MFHITTYTAENFRHLLAAADLTASKIILRTLSNRTVSLNHLLVLLPYERHANQTTAYKNTLMQLSYCNNTLQHDYNESTTPRDSRTNKTEYTNHKYLVTVIWHIKMQKKTMDSRDSSILKVLCDFLVQK